MKRLRDCKLDAYSLHVVPILLARFPEWESFATLVPQPDGNAMVFDIPCPSTAAESGLWVSTAEQELTVGFHTHHSHFTDYETRLGREQIEAGIEFAADIVAERVGVVSWYRGEACTGSRIVELPHADPLPGLLDGLVPAMGIGGVGVACDRTTLRSWTGRYDREER